MNEKLQTVLLAAMLGYLVYTTTNKCPGPACPPSVPATPNSKPLIPQPLPVPVPKVVKVLILSAPHCSWCTKLKSEMGPWPVPVEWADTTTSAGRALAVKYRIEGTPTLIALDTDGGEVRRQLGYKSQAELLAWLTTTGDAYGEKGGHTRHDVSR